MPLPALRGPAPSGDGGGGGGGGSSGADEQPLPLYYWAGDAALPPPLTVPVRLLARAGRTLQQHRLTVLFAVSTGLPLRSLRTRFRALPEAEKAAWRHRASVIYLPPGREFDGMPVLLGAEAAPAQEHPWIGRSPVFYGLEAGWRTAGRAFMFFQGATAGAGAADWKALTPYAKLEWALLTKPAIV